MFWSRFWGWRLKLESPRYINTMILHFLVPKIEEYNIEKVKIIEKMRKIRKVEKIEGVRGVEKVIPEIKET